MIHLYGALLHGVFHQCLPVHFTEENSSHDLPFAHGESKGEENVGETCLGHAANQRWGQQ